MQTLSSLCGPSHHCADPLVIAQTLSSLCEPSCHHADSLVVVQTLLLSCRPSCYYADPLIIAWTLLSSCRCSCCHIDPLVDDDCHGSQKPMGFVVGSTGVWVRVDILLPGTNPYLSCGFCGSVWSVTFHASRTLQVPRIPLNLASCDVLVL